MSDTKQQPPVTPWHPMDKAIIEDLLKQTVETRVPIYGMDKEGKSFLVGHTQVKLSPKPLTLWQKIIRFIKGNSDV